jgi:hypothetical protein
MDGQGQQVSQVAEHEDFGKMAKQQSGLTIWDQAEIEL